MWGIRNPYSIIFSSLSPRLFVILSFAVIGVWHPVYLFNMGLFSACYTAGAGRAAVGKTDTVPPLTGCCLAEGLFLLTDNFISSAVAKSFPPALPLLK